MGKPEKVAEVIARLAGQAPPPWRSMVAERVGDAGRDPQHALLARHLLYNTDTSPEDWRRINEFLKDNRLSLGDTLGSGQERVVFDAIPASGDQRYVFKVGSIDPALYDVPNTPGVVPYTAKGAEGGVAFGVQPRAAKTYADQSRAGNSQWEWWSDRARDVERSLWARGHHWLDYDEGNIGLMPDGMFGVIDGPVRPREGFVPGQAEMPTEDAIRLLRLR
jgi:hypothetical protein